MSTTRLVAKNTLFQILGKGVSTVLGIAAVALVTRALGAAGYGYYTTVITFLSFFGIVADLGLTLITAQMISEQGADEPRIVRSIFTFRVVTALVLFSVAPLVAHFTNYPDVVKWGIALTAASFFFVSLQQTLVGIFQKHLVMHFPMMSEVVGRAALLGVTIYAVAFGKNLLWFLGAVVIGNICNFLLVIFFSRRFVHLGFEWDTKIIREMLHRSLPIAISIVFNLVYLKADTLILSAVRSPAEVGLYGAAYRVIDILIMIPVMMMGVILPIAAAAWSSRDSARMSRIIQKTFDVFVIYALPFLVGGWLLAPRIMSLIAGDDFAGAGAPLRILLLAFVAATSSTLFGHTIVALQKQRSVIWVYGVDAVLSLAAYLFFIPRFGMTGAAWATFGSELFAAIILATVVIRTTRVTIALDVLIRVALASAVMALALELAGDLSAIVSILIGGGMYCATLMLLGIHKKIL